MLQTLQMLPSSSFHPSRLLSPSASNVPRAIVLPASLLWRPTPPSSPLHPCSTRRKSSSSSLQSQVLVRRPSSSHLSRLRGTPTCSRGGGAALQVTMMTSALDATSSPSLADLAALLGPAPAEVRLPHATERLFGSTEEPRVVFFRDNSSWCPYCERVWLQLEEKQIPYRVEKINMNCYGPKPDWFRKMVSSGLLPVVKLDGKVITESMDIMQALEASFPDHRPLLPPPSSPLFRHSQALLRVERQLAGAWLQWARSPWGSQEEFERAVGDVDSALRKEGGPFFLGKEFSLVDAVYAPFLERIAASTHYWKGLQIRNSPKWPALNAWFDAMDAKPAYRDIKSDDFTIAHTLEPQIGPAVKAKAGAAYRAKIDGKDGSWDLPLTPETTAWGADDGSGAGGAKEAAARSLVDNHDAIVRFALRGVKGGDVHSAAVSAGFRHVAWALLEGVEKAGPPPQGSRQEVAVAAAYLRDRVGVPRDLTYPAARQLRAHLQWLIRGLGSDL